MFIGHPTRSGVCLYDGVHAECWWNNMCRSVSWQARKFFLSLIDPCGNACIHLTVLPPGRQIHCPLKVVCSPEGCDVPVPQRYCSCKWKLPTQVWWCLLKSGMVHLSWQMPFAIFWGMIEVQRFRLIKAWNCNATFVAQVHSRINIVAGC